MPEQGDGRKQPLDDEVDDQKFFYVDQSFWRDGGKKAPRREGLAGNGRK